MEKMHADTSLADSYDAYTCAVRSNYHLGCLDVAAVSTLSGSVGSAWNNGYLSVNVSSNTNMFGGSTLCSVEQSQTGPVGDGAVNVYDMSTLIWWHFQVAPYDTLGTDPAAVSTVYQRAGIADRCNTGRLRSDWTALTAMQYCYPDLDPGRRLSEGSGSSLPRMESKVNIREWARVEGKGSWHRVQIEGIQIALELFLDSLYTTNAVELNNDLFPVEGCTDCEPTWHDHTLPTVRFARRYEYEPQGAAKTRECATIVAAFTGSEVMRGNVLGVRQQPINRACEFDLFLWRPVAHATSPVSNRCNRTVGIGHGSSAMDGVRGMVQQSLTCSISLEQHSTNPPPPPPPPATQSDVDISLVILGTIAVTLGFLLVLLLLVVLFTREAGQQAAQQAAQKLTSAASDAVEGVFKEHVHRFKFAKPNQDQLEKLFRVELGESTDSSAVKKGAFSFKT